MFNDFAIRLPRTGLPLPADISRLSGLGGNSLLGIQTFQDSVTGEEGMRGKHFSKNHFRTKRGHLISGRETLGGLPLLPTV